MKDVVFNVEGQQYKYKHHPLTVLPFLWKGIREQKDMKFKSKMKAYFTALSLYLEMLFRLYLDDAFIIFYYLVFVLLSVLYTVGMVTVPSGAVWWVGVIWGWGITQNFKYLKKIFKPTNTEDV